MIDEIKMLSILDDRIMEIENKFIFELKGLHNILKNGYTLQNQVLITIDKAEILKPLIEEYNRILDFKKHIQKHSDFYSLISEAISKQIRSKK